MEEEPRTNKLQVPDRTTVATPQEERSLAALLVSDLNQVIVGSVAGYVGAKLTGGGDKGRGTPPPPPADSKPSELPDLSDQV